LTAFAYLLRRLPVVGTALAAILAALMNLRARLEDKITPEQIRNDNACVFLVRARKASA
jgi:hypothetical protein